MTWKAREALIAWTPVDRLFSVVGKRIAPSGSIAIGLLLSENAPDWTEPYECTGGAAYMRRRKLFGMPQRFAVILDWYQMVYSCGLDPYVAHRAFLEIDEYQAIIKEAGMGPAKDEQGHDPNGYGRYVHGLPKPEIKTHRMSTSFHVWPVQQATGRVPNPQIR